MHDKGRMPVQKKKKKVNKSKLFGIINCIKKRISFQYPTKCVGKTSPKVWYKKQNQNNFSLFFIVSIYELGPGSSHPEP